MEIKQRKSILFFHFDKSGKITKNLKHEAEPSMTSIHHWYKNVSIAQPETLFILSGTFIYVVVLPVKWRSK